MPTQRGKWIDVETQDYFCDGPPRSGDRPVGSEVRRSVETAPAQKLSYRADAEIPGFGLSIKKTCHRYVLQRPKRDTSQKRPAI